MFDLGALAITVALLGAYQLFLHWRTVHEPLYTVHALNVVAREEWVQRVMSRPQHDVLAVQTLRNSVMAASFMAPTGHFARNSRRRQPSYYEQQRQRHSEQSIEETFMSKRIWAATVAVGLLATTSVGTLHAEQRGTSASAHASRHTIQSAQSAHATSSTRAVTRIGGGIAAGVDASALGGVADAVAGGVGVNARAMLSNQAAPDHNVKMVFSLDTGNYLADVRVRVQDRAGRTVIDGVADGPWLYAKLPAGTYTAAASYHGRTVTEAFTVRNRGQRVAHFRWPASVEHQAAVNASVSPILGTGPQEAPRF